MRKQRTIRRPVSIKGVGLHTAASVELTLKPAPEDTGIVFKRVDLPDEPLIPADLKHLSDLQQNPRRTSLGGKMAQVQTVEHLLACLFGLAIDNLLIEINAEEVPGLDGSARGFFQVLQKAEIVEQSQAKRFFALREPIYIEEEEALIAAFPAEEFTVSYTLSYPQSSLGTQYLNLNFTPETFAKELVSARTFCLEEEVEVLKEMGLGKGADFENTIVLGKSGIINNTLRYQDECARHKVLDLLGDLSLIGRPLKARLVAVKSGHALNIKLLRRIEQQRHRYESAGIASLSGKLAQLPLDSAQIMKILPHRSPFLFVDKIIGLEPGKKIVGIKNLTLNDYFFPGHFPGRPVMPGVLILEALAQTAGVLILSRPENYGKLAYFMSMDKVKFRRPALPGDQLCLEIELLRMKARIISVSAKARVEDKICAEAELLFSLVD
jgi:UDP-3-O-[3-hydroxymyristoyl] N-acetylglucosamine deacetylase/3-hydroxyacyl-[acyl-carrier-protein] dehydratase